MSKIFQFLLLGMFSIGFSHVSYAQKDETLIKKIQPKLTGAWGFFDSGITPFKNETAFMNGGGFVVEFNKYFLLGWATTKADEDINFPLHKLVVDDKEYTLVVSDLKYNGVILGFTPGSHKMIHPKFTFLAGKGKITRNFAGNIQTDQHLIAIPQISVELNVLEWFRIEVASGYRFFIDTDFVDGPSRSELSKMYGKLQLNFGFSWD